MKLEVVRDPAAGLVRIAVEVADTASPERAADVAWTAVDRVLTELQGPAGGER